MKRDGAHSLSLSLSHTRKITQQISANMLLRATPIICVPVGFQPRNENVVYSNRKTIWRARFNSFRYNIVVVVVVIVVDVLSLSFSTLNDDDDKTDLRYL